jgi:hypothetical protein
VVLCRTTSNRKIFHVICGLLKSVHSSNIFCYNAMRSCSWTGYRNQHGSLGWRIRRTIVAGSRRIDLRSTRRHWYQVACTRGFCYRRWTNRGIREPSVACIAHTTDIPLTISPVAAKRTIPQQCSTVQFLRPTRRMKWGCSKSQLTCCDS